MFALGRATSTVESRPPPRPGADARLPATGTRVGQLLCTPPPAGRIETSAPAGLAVEFATRERPAADRGGDLLGLAVQPDRGLHLLIADVAGKDEVAWGLGRRIRAGFARALGPVSIGSEDEKLEAAVEEANRGTAASLAEAGRIATAALLEIDLVARRLRLIDCGHVEAVLYRAATGQAEPVAKLPARGGNLPLGVDEGVRYEAMELRVQPDDLVVLLTDGITEAPVPGGGFFGIEGVARLVAAEATKGPVAVAEALLAVAAETIPTDRTPDDIACVVLAIR